MQSRNWNWQIATGLGLLFLVTPAPACNVPVFRYALERWELSPYEITIVHQGALSADHERLIAWLNHYADKTMPPVGDSAKDPRAANIEVRTIDLFAFAPLWADAIQAAALRTRQDIQPRMVVHYPGAGGEAWSVPFTPENARALLLSPARHEIARRILNGQSAVWVFLDGGNKAKDDAAFALLQKQLNHLQQNLQLPELTNTPKDKLINTNIKLRIEFSILRLPRDKAEEAPFVCMLMNSEEGLWKDEPVVFPVFGRGISLYPIIGKGINADVIDGAARFLVGPCVCEVRKLNQNPGTEVLMTMDWEAALKDNQVLPPTAPPLMGLAGFHTQALSTATPLPPSASSGNTPATEPPAGIWHLTRNVLFAAMGGLLLLGLVSFLIRNKKSLRS